MEGPTTNAQDQAEAAAMRSGSGSESRVGGLTSCQIEDGKQKYVLIRVGDRHLVRGAVSAAYHRDAARPTVERLRAAGVDYEILGGGRIVVDRPKQAISIYGYSMGFPWTNGEFKHDVAAQVVKEHYPGWLVTTSNDGY